MDGLRPGEVSLAPEASIQLTATARDANGHTVSGAVFAWASSDPAVVAVDSTGLAAAASLGSAEVTATAGTAVGRLRVVVTHPASIEPRSAGRVVLTSLGETVQLEAVARSGNGQAMPGAVFAWASEDTTVVTVDSTGVATAVSNSQYTVTSTSATVPTGVVATSGPVAEHRWPVEVRQAVAEVVVTAAADTIWGNGYGRLTAEPLDANGHTVSQARVGTVTIRASGRVYTEVSLGRVWFDWSSDNPAVVAVAKRSGGRTGRLEIESLIDYNIPQGLSEGTATITATARGIDVDAAGVGAGSAEITVVLPSPKSLYPIHVNFVGDVPSFIRRAMESAAAHWGRILAPTEAAPFIVERRIRLPGNLSEVVFEAGDVLAPGLHLYVYVNEEEPISGPLAWAGPIDPGGTSDAPMAPAGRIGWNGRVSDVPWTHEDASYVYNHQAYLHKVALHEIGHVLGIGTGGKWAQWKQILPPLDKPWNERPPHRRVYFTDPVAIAAFDRMGGTDFPATTPKIPLNGHSHWGSCVGILGVMMASVSHQSEVTELSMASLQEGYVYDPATIPGRKLDPEGWNTPPACRNGQYDPDFHSQDPPATAPGPWEGFSLEDDVIEWPWDR